MENKCQVMQIFTLLELCFIFLVLFVIVVVCVYTLPAICATTKENTTN